MIELTLELAEKAAKTALAKAKALGTRMTVSVVDESGRLVVTLRGDGTPFFSTETSRAKAVASANFGRPTKEMAEAHAKEPLFWGTVGSVVPGQILTSLGGAPLRKGGRIIGGIGCGGGTAEHDHDCAVAGADAVSG
jgi:glc operon protein GlcG